MANTPTWFYWQEHALFLHIYLQPRASANQITGLHADCLKIRLTAPPLDGRANQALCKLLATIFAVPENQVTIVKGLQHRKKWVRIDRPITLSLLENPVT